MNPNQQQEEQFSLGQQFDSNPFEGMFGGGGQGAPQGMPQGGGQPPVSGGPAEEQAEGEMDMDPAQIAKMQAMQDPRQNPLLPGANPGGSKFLVGAIQQLHGYIGESTDRNEIATARAIISLLTKLIDKDQQKQNERIAGANQQKETPAVTGY